LDVLLLTTATDAEAEQKLYFEQAIPLAMRLGYQSLPGFKIVQTPTRGNFHPAVLVFGSWPSEQKRQEALQRLETDIPNFHALRRKIWTNFDLTYYPQAEAINFSIDKTKYNVVTALWHKDAAAFQAYRRDWLNAVTATGGTLTVELTNGTSPFGYYYRPDCLLIASWEDQAAFATFQERERQLSVATLAHVNQFVIE